MASYSADFKEQMVRKMMPPNSQSVAQISRDTGVPYATLYTWKKQYQARGIVVPAKNTNADKWDAKTKLAAIIQTAAMNEAERSEYCRKNGLYVEQLNEWKKAFEALVLAVQPIKERWQLACGFAQGVSLRLMKLNPASA